MDLLNTPPPAPTATAESEPRQPPTQPLAQVCASVPLGSDLWAAFPLSQSCWVINSHPPQSVLGGARPAAHAAAAALHVDRASSGYSSCNPLDARVWDNRVDVMFV